MNANCRNSTIALDRFKLTKISTINLSSPDSTIASIANEQDLKTIVDNNNRSSSMTGQNEKRNIRSTIAFIKYASLIPLCTQTPTFIAIGMQYLFVEIYILSIYNIFVNKNNIHLNKRYFC